MSGIRQLLRDEPAVVVGTTTGLVDAGIVVLVAFGLPITIEQKTAIDVFLVAGLSFVSMLVVRARVTPV